jgi:hypothetical protein
VFVVRAFLKMRALLGDKRGLAKQLAALELACHAEASREGGSRSFSA